MLFITAKHIFLFEFMVIWWVINSGNLPELVAIKATEKKIKNKTEKLVVNYALFAPPKRMYKFTPT